MMIKSCAVLKADTMTDTTKLTIRLSSEERKRMPPGGAVGTRGVSEPALEDMLCEL